MENKPKRALSMHLSCCPLVSIWLFVLFSPILPPMMGDPPATTRLMGRCKAFLRPGLEANVATTNSSHP